MENNNNDNNKQFNLNLNTNFNVSIENAITSVGVGIGVSKIIKALPPNSRLAGATGISALGAMTYLTSEYINKNNKIDNEKQSNINKNVDNELNNNNNINISNNKLSNNNDNLNNNNIKIEKEDNNFEFNSYFNNDNFDSTYLFSFIENNFLDSLPPKEALLYCCLMFLLIAIYFIIGLSINFIVRYWMNSIKTKNIIIEFLFKWSKTSNNWIILVIIFIILYSLIATIFIIIYILYN